MSHAESNLIHVKEAFVYSFRLVGLGVPVKMLNVLSYSLAQTKKAKRKILKLGKITKVKELKERKKKEILMNEWLRRDGWMDGCSNE